MSRVKGAGRWLTRNRFAWTDVILDAIVIVAAVNSSLPRLAVLAICVAGGLLVGAITIVLQRASQ